MPSSLHLTSPAKINLTLNIVGRRKDGYHDLVSLMCPVGLYDEIAIHTGRGVSVRCDHPGVPEDETNLVCRAAHAFFERVAPGGGCHIVLTKHIPVGAGLGGGSGNAAAVLNGLNQLHGEPLSPSERCRLGRRIGSDVPFFIDGRPAVAAGVGDRLTPVTGLPRRWVVLVYPGFGVSTRAAYEGLCSEVSDPNLALTKSENLHKSLLLKVRDSLPENYLCNDLEAVVMREYPALAGVKTALSEQGAAGAMMTGSGSCVFGLFDKSERAAAAGRALAKTKEWRVFTAPLLTAG